MVKTYPYTPMKDPFQVHINIDTHTDVLVNLGDIGADTDGNLAYTAKSFRFFCSK